MSEVIDGAEPAPGAVEAAGARPRASRPTWWHLAGGALAVLLVVFPVLRMTGLVLDATRLQYNDYWTMVVSFLNEDGSLDVGGVFEFQNHPVVVPKLVYWVNVRLFGGSNVALGLFVVGLGLAQLGVLASLARRSGLRVVHQVALLVLASALLFNLNGTWNFVKAMSGTAWLTANLFALVAIHQRSRDRRLVAFGAGVLSAVSYGTGLMVWPALVVTGMARQPWRRWWREAPYLIAFVATYVWYREEAGESTPLAWPSVGEGIEMMAEVLTYPFGVDGPSSPWLGGVALVGIPSLALLALVSKRAAAAPWIGIAVFGLLATLAMAVGRGMVLASTAQPRYTSLAAVAWIGLVGLVLVVVLPVARERLGVGRNDGAAGTAAPATWLGLAVVAPLALAALVTGSDQADALRDTRTNQELGAIAWRLRLNTSSAQLIAFGTPVSVAPLLEANDHYPFVDGWDLDCGLAGARIAPPDPAQEGAEPVGDVLSAVERFVMGGVVVSGWVPEELDADCVVVAGDDGEVVGAAYLGATGVAGADPGRGEVPFKAVAEWRNEAYQLYAILSDGRSVPVGDELPASEVRTP